MSAARILVVDDIDMTPFAIQYVLDANRDALGFTAEVVGATSVAHARRRLTAGGPGFDLALVDLGLGPGQPSGLGAIALLKEAGVRRIVVRSEISESGGRLLFTYAAFHWFQGLLALLPAATTGTPGDPDPTAKAKEIGRAVAALLQGRDPNPNITEPVRKAAPRIDEIISSGRDARLWLAFVEYSSTADIAKALQGNKKAFDEWATKKYDVVSEVLRSAPSFFNVDLLKGKRTGDHARKPVQAGVHAFAVGQEWFFRDPAVQVEISRRGT